MVISADSSEPHLERGWHDQLAEGEICGWAATQLVERGDWLILPGRPSVIGDEVIRRARCVVLLGERRAGATALMNHWLRSATDIGRLAFMVHGNRGLWRTANDKSARTEALLPLVKNFHKSPGEHIEGLLQAAASMGGLPLTLIIPVDDGPEAQDVTRATIAGLRGAWERAAGDLQLVIVSPSLHLVYDTLVNSGLMSVADAYRLPSMRDGDVLSAFARRLPALHDRDTQAAATARLLRQATGGQPFLVHTAFERCLEIAKGANTLAPRQVVEHAIRLLQITPPPIVRVWQEHLKFVLERQPQLVRLMEEYVEGVSKRIDLSTGLASVEVELFATGWVDVHDTPDGRHWGVRSRLHREWARPILWEVR